MRTIVVCLALFLCGWNMYQIALENRHHAATNQKEDNMQLGNFSISLTVKDLQASKAFYEKLGFKVSGGDLKRNYLIMQNDASTIGLYQGMFEKNTLTYNPGWDRHCQTLPAFQDLRDIQKELKKRGLKLLVEAEESSKGSAFLTLVDPDGNPILIDQHVPRPAGQ